MSQNYACEAPPRVIIKKQKRIFIDITKMLQLQKVNLESSVNKHCKELKQTSQD